MHCRIVLVMAALAAGLLAGSANAQIDILSGKRLRQPNGQLLAPQDDAPKFNVRGAILPADGKQPAKLSVTADIAAGWHIYSITQAPGGPLKTKINLDKSNEFRLVGEFQAVTPAQKHTYPKIWPGLVSEEHSGAVTWQVPIEFAPGIDPAQVQIRGAVNAQTCNDTTCLPPASVAFTASATTSVVPANEPVPANVAVSKPAPVEPAAQGDRIYRRDHVSLHGEIEPAIVKPGGRASLILTADPVKPWHIYALAERDPQKLSKPTLIEIARVSGLRFEAAKSPNRPISEPSAVPGDGMVSFHDRQVNWTVEITVPADAAAGDYPIEGLIGFQVCSAVSCDSPSAARFSGLLRVGDASSPGPTSLSFTPAKYPEVAQIAAARPVSMPNEFEIADTGASVAGLPVMILLSLLGGLILNLMPCVLPVIGLKVLAFVEQAGQSRSRILLLNLWYAAGMLVVFMALATLAVTLNLGWGQQFSSTGFNITMCVLVFAMALSFLGVWEIPLPGFVGTGGAANYAAREGAAGAFAKGIFTTVLATPCSGPFLGSVFGFTLKQPPYVTYIIFASIGLGMASPYLLIGAFPRLVSFLPKPGAWMETFKQLMAFMLLGTVVFMFSFMDRDYLVPTFALLIGVWAACWWIGRTPWTVSSRRRMLSWLEGAAIAAVVGSFAFTYMVPRESVLKWQSFSQPTLAELTSERKTVMIDFTAEWCLNCKLNLRNAIETQKVAQIVEANHVVPLLADLTQESAEIKQMLELLGSKSIPVLAIFPAGQPNKPIVLRDLITQGQLIKALEQAGPSQDKPSVAGNAKSQTLGAASKSAADLSRN